MTDQAALATVPAALVTVQAAQAVDLAAPAMDLATQVVNLRLALMKAQWSRFSLLRLTPSNPLESFHL